jgi:TPP-dependent pyruvate/acetoin dehydrogenase alpha subunit
LEKQLFEHKEMDEATKTEIQERVQREVDDAVTHAESRPKITEEDLYTGVYGSEISSIGS